MVSDGQGPSAGGRSVGGGSSASSNLSSSLANGSLGVSNEGSNWNASMFEGQPLGGGLVAHSADVSGLTSSPSLSQQLRVHASFSSQIPAPLLSQIQSSVTKAGFYWSATHTAQTEDWFTVWAASARLAWCIVVLYTVEYKSRFTPALKQEAELIYELHQSGTRVYVFDGDTMKPAEVQVCFV